MNQEKAVYQASPESEMLMLEPEIIQRIRAFAELGWGSKRIAQELCVARNTARRYLRNLHIVGPHQRPQRRSLGAEMAAEAARLLREEAAGNAVVVHRLLGTQGARASVRTVQRVVAPERVALRAAQVASVRFETAPGKQMQIDFGEKRVSIGGEAVKVHFFVAVLGYSRRIFVRAFLSERHDDWREGIVGACERFGGRPESLLIDNPKAMVLENTVDSEGQRRVILHPGFKAFCKDWGLEARACAPYRARTKGKTESGVKYVKRNALAGLSFASMAALEAHLAAWMQLADGRIHGTTHERPGERFEQAERLALRPLPQRPTPVRERRLRRRVHNDCFVNIDTARYSVPYRFVGNYVEVRVGCDDVRVYAGSACIAQHQRSLEPHAWVRNAEHFDGLLKRCVQVPSSGTVTATAAIQRPLQAYADAIAGGAP
jgi:transposase